MGTGSLHQPAFQYASGPIRPHTEHRWSQKQSFMKVWRKSECTTRCQDIKPYITAVNHSISSLLNSQSVHITHIFQMVNAEKCSNLTLTSVWQTCLFNIQTLWKAFQFTPEAEQKHGWGRTHQVEKQPASNLSSWKWNRANEQSTSSLSSWHLHILLKIILLGFGLSNNLECSIWC